MQDPKWQAVFDAVAPLLIDTDIVLAPFGDWPTFCCAIRYYQDVIEPRDATVLLLHKGRLPGLRKDQAQPITETWQCVFANDVFVCFTATRRVRRDRRLGLGLYYYARVFLYLAPRHFRRRRATTFFVHLPKAAGTAVWTSIRRNFPASIYYPSIESFVHNPPDVDDYDLIGGHIPLALLSDYLTTGSYVIGLMREPTERFRSAFLHSRRADEDPSTFTPVMQAMRSMPLSMFLDTPDARMEMRQQLLMLGFPFDRPFSTEHDCDVYRNAVSNISRGGTLLYPMERLNDFLVASSNLLGVRLRLSGRMNVTDRAAQISDIREFDSQIERVHSENHVERRLYNLICNIPDRGRNLASRPY